MHLKFFERFFCGFSNQKFQNQQERKIFTCFFLKKNSLIFLSPIQKNRRKKN